MSAMRDVWDTLRAVASVIDKVAALSEDLRELRAENQLLRERVIRIETIIDEARRNAGPRRLPRD